MSKITFLIPRVTCDHLLPPDVTCSHVCSHVISCALPRAVMCCHLKGQCHVIFDFWFFSWINFHQAPEYTIMAISNFFENSWRYLRLKVHHRCPWRQWQMEKIINQKSFNYFVWTSLGSRVNININFCLQVHFKDSAAWYCFLILPPVLMTPAANLPLVSCRWYWCAGGIFAAGVGVTGGKFATSVVDTGGAPWLANISVNFRKNLKRS